MNEELNKSTFWINKECVYCKRKYPEIILNIEGYLHHKAKLACLDTKSCNKYKNKQR